jgi:hypothetical protein
LSLDSRASELNFDVTVRVVVDIINVKVGTGVVDDVPAIGLCRTE